MFGIGPTELIVILVIALIVVGPERLPQLAGQIGKAIRDFRQMSGDMTGEFQRAFQLEDETPATSTSVPTDTVLPWAASSDTGETTPALTAQVIPTEPTSETVAATVENAVVADEASAATSNGSHADPPVATKADPLIDVSFLDEPEESMTTYESLPVATFGVQPLGDAAESGTPNSITDAWDAVMTTESTISLPERTAAELQAELQAETAGTAVALAEPPPVADDTTTFPVQAVQAEHRAPIDPAGEPTIREVVEAQVAAETFRERRRIATYRRHK